MMVLYVIDFGDIFLRLFLPAVPALGLVWAYGYERVQKLGKFVPVLLILSLVAFSTIELVKPTIAAQQYLKYEQDFAWARENLPRDATIAPPSSYLVYHLNRLAADGEGQVYYWIGDLEKIETLTIDSSWQLVYDSPTTEVKIYTNS